jgi:galactokinase
MDQSASVFPQQGKAVYVSFKPELSVRHVEFPKTDPELTFVVAQSFVAADKHVSAPRCYNLRVVEVSLAATLLAKIFRLKKPLPEDASPLGVSLRGFHDAYFEEIEGITDNTKTSVDDFGAQLEKLITMVEDYVIQEDGYTRDELSDLLGMSVEEIGKHFESKFKVEADRFMLRQRALHVFAEAQRVLKFMSLLTSPPSASDGGSDALLRGLGDLMNETQDSCRDVYDCSCAELDELCKLARGAGAYGSRLTGAGWGGCTVHLVPKLKVEKVTAAWENKYYRKKFPDITQERLSEAVVVSKPGSGSCVLKVTDSSFA